MSDLPPAQIPDTEVRDFKSKHTGQEYRISVALPYEYHDLPDKQYQTVYILDSNLHFGMFTEISRMLYLCGLVETIIVGIGYPINLPLEEGFSEIMSLRAFDLTPVEDKFHEDEYAKAGLQVKGTGGASKFLSFFEEELIPFIETEYRTTGEERTLVGHSDGGTFALYTLFQKPTLFQNLIVGSPVIYYADGILFNYEEQFSKDQESLPVRLFLSAGELEESINQPYVSNLFKFAARLQSRDYKGFKLTSRIFENCNHCAAIAPMFQFGMMEMLPGR